MNELVEDEIAQTDVDFFSGKFCHCGHLIENHENGILIKKCYALSFNSLVWSACNCKNSRPTNFKIEVEIDADEFSRINKNTAKNREQVQLTAFKEI